MNAKRPARPIKVYSASVSGHAHRVRLFFRRSICRSRSWLARIEALPGFVPTAATRIGLAA